MLYLFPKQWKHSAMRTPTRAWFIPVCLDSGYQDTCIIDSIFSVRETVSDLERAVQLCVLYQAERQAIPHSLCGKIPPSQHREGKKRGEWREVSSEIKSSPPCLSQRLSYPSKCLAGRIISIKRGYSPYKLSHNGPLYPKTTNSWA